MELTIPIRWIKIILVLTGAAGLLLGILSSAFPARSIQLYQGLMRAFNWRVEPVDYERELRNTRYLGVFLVAINLWMLITLFLLR